MQPLGRWIVTLIQLIRFICNYERFDVFPQGCFIGPPLTVFCPSPQGAFVEWCPNGGGGDLARRGVYLRPQ